MRLIKRFAVTCGLSAFSALAQQPAGPPGDHHGPPPGHRPPPSPLMMVLDTNRDGELDATEIASASAALLTLDKNGDGKLTAEELRPPLPPGGTNHPNFGPPPPGHRPPPGPLMAALDTNKDGELDADEIANASASLLKLDANGDGKLTRDELRPKFPPPGHPEGGQRPGAPGEAPPPLEGPGEPPPGPPDNQ